MKILNNKGPKNDLCETPNNILLQELYLSFIFTLFFYLSGKYVLTLKNFYQNHTHLAQRLKAHEAVKQKRSIDH